MRAAQRGSNEAEENDLELEPIIGRDAEREESDGGRRQLLSITLRPNAMCALCSSTSVMLPCSWL